MCVVVFSQELKSLKGFPLATPTPPFNKRIIPRTSMSVCPQMSMIAYGDNMSPNINGAHYSYMYIIIF